MACARKSDREEILEEDREKILQVLKKMSVKNFTDAKPKHPSEEGTTLGPHVSLVRNVAVPPIIVFNCFLLF